MSYHRELNKRVWASVSTATLVIIAGLLVLSMWVFSWGWFSELTANTRGETSQREQTIGNGQYRIAHYDAFFDKCQAIVATEGNIADTEDALKTDDSTAKYFDEQNLRAMKSNRRDLITSYNADALKEDTAGHFRSSKLPAQIDENGKTSCTN